MKRSIMVREKWVLVREKSVKSQGISFQPKSGHPDRFSHNEAQFYAQLS